MIRDINFIMMGFFLVFFGIIYAFDEVTDELTSSKVLLSNKNYYSWIQNYSIITLILSKICFAK